MASAKLANKSTAEVALDFVNILNNYAQHRRIDDVAAGLATFAPRIADPEFLSTVQVLARLQTGPVPATPAPALRIQPPKWKGSKAQNRKTGAKTWTVQYHGMTLRVDHVQTPDNGVIFEGSIDGVPICREKFLRVAQEHLDAEAVNRVRAKAAA